MNRSRLAVVVGFVAKWPLAGMAMYNFHYIAGIRALGYDVYYVERANTPGEFYSPDRDEVGDDFSFGLKWLARCMRQIPQVSVPWTFIDRAGGCHGGAREDLRKALGDADFVLTLADPTWFDDLEICPRRAFVDGDPLFTQAAMLEPDGDMASTLARYPALFTYWTRQNASDTTVPAAGRDWISTTPVVATDLWEAAPPRPGSPVTTVMNWAATKDVELGGRAYGHKNREFERFASLPTLADGRFVLAVGGPAPKARLQAQGWSLANPLQVTGSLEAYRSFIAGSFADLGIAKHAYVASRSGWFSDRSLCYLASGRPVLHQDTGFTDWLPVGEGVFAFSTTEDVERALAALGSDYLRHAQAARAMAEQHFEARTVIGRMLDQAGFH